MTKFGKFLNTLRDVNSHVMGFGELSQFIKKKKKLKAFEITKELLFVFADERNKLFRRLRWYAFPNRTRSEHRMVMNMKKVFGTPDQVVIAFGNYSSGSFII